MSASGGGLILAAGRGSRYGSDKRCAVLNSGRTLLESTLTLWQQTLPTLRVVLRAKDEYGERELAASLCRQFPNLAITFATHSRNGMGASLGAGIRDCENWNYALIGLGDMPYLSSTTLQTLNTKLQKQIANNDFACIVRPTQQGRPGHPVGFGRDHFAALSRLDGDVGARAIIQGTPGVIDVPCVDPGIHWDVDTPEGLRAHHA